MRVELVREPQNKHDPNAIAVVLIVPFLLFFKRRAMIGYIKASRAEKLAETMDAGTKVAASVASFYAPEDRDHPRVSLDIEVFEGSLTDSGARR